MKEINLLGIVFFSILMLFGCSNTSSNTRPNIPIQSEYYTPEYIFNLQSVNINGKDILDIDKEKLKFEDKNLVVTFKIKHKAINIEVFNKKNDTLKLLWNDVIYIDYDGKGNGIIHNGIKYSEKDLMQYPSFIAANSQIQDTIVPRNKTIFLGSWYIRDLLSSEGNNVGTFNTDTKTKAENEALLYVGKKISLIIPIQTQDKIEKYTFNFLVKDFKVVTFNRATY